jgi:hypothetical protein
MNALFADILAAHGLTSGGGIGPTPTGNGSVGSEPPAVVAPVAGSYCWACAEEGKRGVSIDPHVHACRAGEAP